MDIRYIDWVNMVCALLRIADVLEYMAGKNYEPNPEYIQKGDK